MFWRGGGASRLLLARPLGRHGHPCLQLFFFPELGGAGNLQPDAPAVDWGLGGYMEGNDLDNSGKCDTARVRYDTI